MFQLFKGKRNEKRSLKLPPGLSKKDQRRVQEVIDRAKKNDGIPRTAQQSIPFDRMFPDGICRVGSFYTKTIQFQDINYQLAQQEDKTAIFEEWCGFLNFFDSSIHFELSFMNMTTDAESFEAGIRIPYRKDDFNSVRDEYSEMLKAQLAQGNNGLTKTKFLTFGIEADSMKQAKPRLEHVQNDLLNNFKQLGVRAEVLNGYQRLKLMHDMFHMGDPEDKFRFDWKWLVESGLSVKDFIAPTAFAFPGSRTFQMGSIFGAMSYLQITASDLSDQLLKDFLDMDSSQIITMHIQSVDQTEAIKTIKHTITELDRSKIEEQKKAVRSGYDMDIIRQDPAGAGHQRIPGKLHRPETQLQLKKAGLPAGKCPYELPAAGQLPHRYPPCTDHQLHGDFCSLYHPGAVPVRKGIPVLRPERSFQQPDHGGSEGPEEPERPDPRYPRFR